VDGDELVLHQGNQILISFDHYPLAGKVSEWWVVAVGYYSPL
jgi:hypothetical protein